MYGITAITHYNGARAWRVTLYRAGAKEVEKEFPFLSHGGELHRPWRRPKPLEMSK